VRVQERDGESRDSPLNSMTSRPDVVLESTKCSLTIITEKALVSAMCKVSEIMLGSTWRRANAAPPVMGGRSTVPCDAVLYDTPVPHDRKRSYRL
jgi:hypothetical protein